MVDAAPAVRITGTIKVVLGSSNDRRNNEHGLARERKADAFQANQTRDYQQPVDVNEVFDGWHGNLDQTRGPSIGLLSLPLSKTAS